MSKIENPFALQPTRHLMFVLPRKVEAHRRRKKNKQKHKILTFKKQVAVRKEITCFSSQIDLVIITSNIY